MLVLSQVETLSVSKHRYCHVGYITKLQSRINQRSRFHLLTAQKEWNGVYAIDGSNIIIIQHSLFCFISSAIESLRFHVVLVILAMIISPFHLLEFFSITFSYSTYLHVYISQSLIFNFNCFQWNVWNVHTVKEHRHRKVWCVHWTSKQFYKNFWTYIHMLLCYLANNVMFAGTWTVYGWYFIRLLHFWIE